MLQIYNTLSRSKEVFKPIESGKVKIYVCGMTVYDFCHIGHARVMIVFDMVVRWLRASGYEVLYVRNITDIDDKIINRAIENKESIAALTSRFIDAMRADYHFTNTHKGSVKSLAFSPLNRLLLCSAGVDRSVSFYDLNEKVTVKKIKTDISISKVAFCSDGYTIAVASD